MTIITWQIPFKWFLCQPGVGRRAFVLLIEAEYIPFNKRMWHWSSQYCRKHNGHFSIFHSFFHKHVYFGQNRGSTALKWLGTPQSGR